MFEGRVTPFTAVMSASPDELLDELVGGAEPGPWMLGVLDGLRELVETDSAREKLLVGWERFMAWAQLQRAHAVVMAATPQSAVEGPFGVDDLGPEVIALLTGVTTVSARTSCTLPGRSSRSCRAATRRWPAARSAGGWRSRSPRPP